MAAGFELDAQLLEIVNLAVEDDDDVAVFVGHRLMAQGREVDDRQPAVAETDRSIGIAAFAIGTTVRDDVGHALEEIGGHRFALAIANANNATHGTPSKCLVPLTRAPLTRPPARGRPRVDR